MAIKAINNLAKLNRIVPTFLVFKVYLRITKIDTLSPFIIKRAEAICIATKEVRCLQVER